MNNHADYVMRALRSMKGDDLERAEHAFHGMSEEELDQEYGRSEQTCREILEGYRDSRRDHEAACNWLANRLEETQ